MLKLMLIDDEKTTRDRLASHLRAKTHYQVDEFEDGNKALERFRQNIEEYQAILSDWTLPAPANGSYILDEVRRMNRHLPVIIFTGNSEASAEAYAKGAYAYFHAPLDHNQIVEAIEDIAQQDATLHTLTRNIHQTITPNQVLFWRYDKMVGKFHLKAWAISGNLKRNEPNITIDLQEKGLPDFLKERKITFILPDKGGTRYHSPELAGQNGWTTFICTPMYYNKELIGLIDCCFKGSVEFSSNYRQRVEQMLSMYTDQSAEAFYLAEQNRKNRQILNMSSLLMEHDSMEDIADAVLSLGIQLIGADAAWLYLHDFSKQELSLIACRGEGSLSTSLKRASKKRIAMGETLAGLAAQEAQVETIKDIAYAYPTIPVPTPAEICTQVAVPLRRLDLVSGVLVMGRRKPDSFTEGDITLLGSLATLSGPLLDQTRMRLSLRDIGRAAFQSKQQIGKDFINAVYALTGKPVALWLVDENSNRLVEKASRGMVSECALRKGTEIFLDASPEGLVARAIHTREPQNCADLFNPEFNIPTADLECAREEDWKSALVIPFFDSERRPLGTLNLYNTRKRPFDKGEIDFLNSFLDQVGIAFENEQRREGLQKLLESGRLVAVDTPNEQKALKKIVDTARTLTGATSAVIYPIDSVQSEFFDTDHIVTSDGKKPENYKNYSKPRIGGVSTLIRANRLLVVDDVEKGVVHNSENLLLTPSEIPSFDETARDPERLVEIIQTSSFIQDKNARAFLGISLRVAEEKEAGDEVGILFINYATPHHFTKSEINLVELLAQQAANLIHTTRLWKRQQTLIEVNKSLAVAKTIPDILSRVFHKMFAFIGLSRGMVLLRKEDHTLEIIDSEGLTQKQINAFNHRPVKENEGSFGFVIRNREVFSSTDIHVDSRLKDFGLFFEHSNQIINIPVKCWGDVRAILVFDKVVTNRQAEQAVWALADMAGTALEKALVNQEREKQLNALQRIIDSLGKEANPLAVILQESIKLFNAHHGNIALAVKALRKLDYRVEWDDGKLIEAQDINPKRKDSPYDEGISGHVATTGKPYRSGDVTHDPYYANWYSNSRSELAVPLIDSLGEVLGVIILESDDFNAFTKEDEDLCVHLADMAVVSIEKSELLRTSKLLREEIQDLGSIPTSPDLQGAMNRVVKGLVKLLGENSCSANLCLYEDDEKEFLPAMAAAGSLRDYLLEIPPRRAEGVGKYVIRNEKPVYIEDVENPPEDVPSINPKFPKLGVRSFAAFPLIRRHHKLGALFIHLKQPINFTPDLRNSLALYALQAAIAVDDAQRTWIGDAMREIQDASVNDTFESFIQLVMDKAVDLMQADFGALWLAQPAGSLHLRAAKGMVPVGLENIPPAKPDEMNSFFPKKHQIISTSDLSTGDSAPVFVSAQSALTMPILYQGDFIGTVRLESKETGIFTDYNAMRLARFIAPTAIAIHNANLNDQNRRLRDFSQKLNRTSDQQEIINIILSNLRLMIDYTSASVQIFHGDRREVYVIRGEDKRAVPAEPGGGLHRNISKDKLVLEIVNSKQAKVLSDVRTDGEGLWVPFEDTKHILSWMGIPLIVNQQMIGFLAVDHTVAGRYTPKDAQALMAFTEIAAGALYRSKQDTAQRQMAELSELILQTQDFDLLMKTIAKKALEVLEADVIQLFEYFEEERIFRQVPYSHGELLVATDPRKIMHADDVVHTYIQRSLPQYIEDSRKDPILSAPLKGKNNQPKKRFVVREEIASTAIVPLINNNKKVGLLFVNYRFPQTFDDQQRLRIELFASQAAIAMNNARLVQDLQSRHEELRLLNEAGREVSASVDLHIVLVTLLQKVYDLLKVDSVSIWLIDPKTRDVECREAIGKADDKVKGYILKEGEGLVGVTIRERRSILVADASADDRHHDLRELTGLELHSIASVPLLAGHTVIGVLQAVDERAGLFNQDHLGMLEPLAGFAASATMNAARLQFVQDLAIWMAANDDPKTDQALEIIREAAYSIAGFLMDAENTYIALYDTEKEEVSFALAYVGGVRIDTQTAKGWGKRRKGHGMTERVIETKKSILIETKAESERKYTEWGMANYIKVNFASWVGVPMLVGEKVIGVIAVYHPTEEKKYTMNDLRALELIAAQVTLALAQTGLIEERNRTIRELKALNDLSKALGEITGFGNIGRSS